MRGFTIAAGIGFFIALLLAWYHGERGAQKVSGAELVLLSLLLLIGGGLLWKFAPSAPEIALPTAAPTPGERCKRRECCRGRARRRRAAFR